MSAVFIREDTLDVRNPHIATFSESSAKNVPRIFITIKEKSLRKARTIPQYFILGVYKQQDRMSMNYLNYKNDRNDKNDKND